MIRITVRNGSVFLPTYLFVDFFIWMRDQWERRLGRVRLRPALGLRNVFSPDYLTSVNNVLNKYNLEKMALSLTDDFDVVKNVQDECGQISVTRFMKVSFGSIFFAQVNDSLQRKGLKRFCISQLMISVLIRL